jgi:hypothetical protein
MASHTLRARSQRFQISRICNYLKCHARGVKPEFGFDHRTIGGASGLRKSRVSLKGESVDFEKAMFKQCDDAVSLTSPRNIIRLLRCNVSLTS